MAALESPRELKDLMEARAAAEAEIGRLDAEINVRARELGAKIGEMFPFSQSATARFVGGSMRVEIHLSNATTISRAEFHDGLERHSGWVLHTCCLDRSPIPLASIRRSLGYAQAQKSLCDTMAAQQIVGLRVIQCLIALEKEHAYCMFPEGTTPANYAQVRADRKGVLSVEGE